MSSRGSVCPNRSKQSDLKAASAPSNNPTASHLTLDPLMAQIFLLFFLLKNPPQSERRPVSDAARPSTPLWKNIFAQFCHHSPKQEDTRTVGVTVLFFFCLFLVKRVLQSVVGMIATRQRINNKEAVWQLNWLVMWGTRLIHQHMRCLTAEVLSKIVWPQTVPLC